MTTTRPRRPARVSGALLNQRTTSSSGAVIAAAIVIRRSSCRLALAAILAQDHWRMKRRPERAASSREAGFAPLRHSSSRNSHGSAAFAWRSEEHTSELQSLMRISYAVFCLQKKTTLNHYHHHNKDIHSKRLNSSKHIINRLTYQS